MALTGDQIEEITRSVVQLYQGAEAAIVEEITRYLAEGLDAPDWATNRLAALNTIRETVEQMLAVVAEEGAEEIRDTLADAYRTGSAAATTGVPASALPQSEVAAQAAAAAAQEGIRAAVVENLAVALVQDIGAKHSNVLRHVQDVYRGVIQQATAVSVAGGMTRRQAAQWAYARFVDQGVVSFTDAAGRQWRLSSYVEMATRTVTQRAAVQGQTDRLQRLGIDTVIVSNSPRECPKCRPWEGKVLSISGRLRGEVELPSIVRKTERVAVEIAGSVEDARAAGLQHPNCTHALRAYLPGATKVPQGDLSDAKGYEAKQRQREIERHIRRWKEREVAALDLTAKTAARGKVKQWQAAMRDHLAAHPDLKRLSYREQPGAGNVPRPRRAPRPPSRQQELDLTPQAPADPLDGIVLEDLPEDDLYDLFARVSSGDQLDDAVIVRLTDEMERRERAAAPPTPDPDAWLSGTPANERFDWPDPDDLTPEQRQLDELLDQGEDYLVAYAQVYGLDAAALARQAAASTVERRAGETVDQATRRAYDEWVHVQYLQAEAETSGVLLNRAGVTAGIDPVELFGGTLARARKYASEELLRWWTEHDRLTYQQFRAQTLQREADIRGAERTRGQSNDQDFV